MTQAQVAADSSGVPVVRAEAIKKSFGHNVVLDGIDLDVGTGEALVVIGAQAPFRMAYLRRAG